MRCLKCGLNNPNNAIKCVKCGTPLPPAIPELTEVVHDSPLLTYLKKLGDRVESGDIGNDELLENLMQVRNHMEGMYNQHLTGEEDAMGKEFVEGEYLKIKKIMEEYISAIDLMLDYSEEMASIHEFRWALGEACKMDMRLQETMKEDRHRRINIFSHKSRIDLGSFYL